MRSLRKEYTSRYVISVMRLPNMQILKVFMRPLRSERWNQARSRTAVMSDGRKIDHGMDKLTDPQYAVVKQLRIPVAVVITIQIEGVRFRRSNGVSWETLTRNELGRGCLYGWIGIAESGFFIVRYGEGDESLCSGSV